MARKGAPHNRNKSGQFVKGQSGNPSGRVRQPPELQARCRDVTNEVIDFWTGLVRKGMVELKRGKPSSPLLSVANAAALNLMSYGYGKPLQQIEFPKDEKGRDLKIVFEVQGQETSLENTDTT